jgi:hypothetical protein
MSRYFGFSRANIWIAFVLLALTGCGQMAAPQPTATPTTGVDGVGDAAVAMIEQQMYSQLTQQAIENDRIEAGARSTATQQVIDATATQQVRQENAHATAQSAQATQQAWQVTVSAAQAQDTATAQANATATERAVLATTATVQAAATATSAQATQQAPMLFAQQTAIFAQARKTEIELQKSTATMWVSAWGGWVFALVVIVLASFVIWKKSQVGVIPTDQNGKPQMVVINQGGQKILVSPSLMPAPMLTVSRNGASMPMLVDPAFQEKTTHGAQVIEAIASLPPGYNRQAMGLAGGLAAPNGAGSVNIQVVQPGAVQGWLDDVQGRVSEIVEED